VTELVDDELVVPDELLVPESALVVPESELEVPESAFVVPESELEVPESAFVVPESELELAVGVSVGEVRVSDVVVVVVVLAAVVVLSAAAAVRAASRDAASWAAVSWAAATATTPVRPSAPAIIPRLARLISRSAARRRLVGEGVMSASLGRGGKRPVKRPSAECKSRMCGFSPDRFDRPIVPGGVTSAALGCGRRM
jgi:hypothetical protein